MFTKELKRKKQEATKKTLTKTISPLQKTRKTLFKVGPHHSSGGMAVPHGTGWPCHHCTGGTVWPATSAQVARPYLVAREARATFLFAFPGFVTWHALPLLSGTACFTWHFLLVWPSSRIDFGLLFGLILKLPTEH